LKKRRLLARMRMTVCTRIYKPSCAVRATDRFSQACKWRDRTHASGMLVTLL
jgi:hypothetical protein